MLNVHAGFYLFTMTVTPTEDEVMMAQLYVVDTDQVLLATGSHGDSVYSHNSGTTVVVTECAQGQRVLVRTDEYVPREMYGDTGENRVSSFTGVMLSLT